jgi:hypothetical protein
MLVLSGCDDPNQGADDAGARDAGVDASASDAGRLLGTRCTDSNTCGAFHCVIASDSDQGSCQEGFNGDDCFAPEDCTAPARCARASDATLGFCTEGAIEDHCVEDSDCASEHCAQEASDPRCTEGELGQPCGGADDCASGYCVKGLTNNQVPPWGACGDGQLMAPCGFDEDCESEHCVPSFGCVTGRVGDWCMQDEQCDSLHCTATAYVGICATQELDEPCSDDSDCGAGRCGFEAAIMESGFCTDGLENSWCAMSDDCQSQFCATNGGDQGVCSRRALDSPCLPAGADQCDQGMCSLDSSSLTGYACSEP